MTFWGNNYMRKMTVLLAAVAALASAPAFAAGITGPRVEAVIGWDNVRVDLDGLGAQYALGSHAYLGAEYRYSNYEAGLSRHQAVGTIGFRF